MLPTQVCIALVGAEQWCEWCWSVLTQNVATVVSSGVQKMLSPSLRCLITPRMVAARKKPNGSSNASSHQRKLPSRAGMCAELGWARALASSRWEGAATRDACVAALLGLLGCTCSGVTLTLTCGSEEADRTEGGDEGSTFNRRPPAVPGAATGVHCPLPPAVPALLARLSLFRCGGMGLRWR